MHQEQQGTLSIFQSDDGDIDLLTNMVEENDVCIYWYFGSHGLKEGAIDFYKNHISSNICKGATPCLVDLTAWGSFYSATPLLSKSNKNVETICTSPLIGYKTASFFAELRSVTDSNEALFSLLKNILAREELMDASSSYKESGKKLDMAFGGAFPLIEDISDRDASTCYSVFQYIEFLYIIKSVLQNKPETSRIRFHLANDENKYYPASLTEDLLNFLKADGIAHGPLEIRIDCFTYGAESMHRPYNSPGKVVKKTLKIYDVINDEAQATIQNGCGMTV